MESVFILGICVVVLIITVRRIDEYYRKKYDESCNIFKAKLQHYQNIKDQYEETGRLKHVELASVKQQLVRRDDDCFVALQTINGLQTERLAADKVIKQLQETITDLEIQLEASNDHSMFDRDE